MRGPWQWPEYPDDMAWCRRIPLYFLSHAHCTEDGIGSACNVILSVVCAADTARKREHIGHTPRVTPRSGGGGGGAAGTRSAGDIIIDIEGQRRGWEEVERTTTGRVAAGTGALHEAGTGYL